MDSKLRCVFELPEDKKVQSKIVAQIKSDQNTSSGNEATQESGIGEDKVIAFFFYSNVELKARSNSTHYYAATNNTLILKYLFTNRKHVMLLTLHAFRLK